MKAIASLEPSSTATPEAMIEHCKARIAVYKYPRSVEIVDEGPKTATGKFLRRVLRDKSAADTAGTKS